MAADPFYITLAASLATHLAEKLLDATTRRVREKFSGDKQKQALTTALQEGLETSLSSFHLEKVDEDHFNSMFEDFLYKPVVIDELTHIIDPRPSAEIDLNFLLSEFTAEGFDSETLIYFDFETFIVLFCESFYDSAAKQPELQGAIQIGLLRKVVDQIKDISKKAERTASASEQTATATTQIADEFSPLMERFLRGQAHVNEVIEVIQKITQQGFAQIYELLEKIVSTLQKSGFDVEPADDYVRVSGDKTQTEGLPGQNDIRVLQVEISRLRQSVDRHQPNEADLALIKDRYCQHIINWFERLTFQGMMRTAQAISLPLEDVYVELRAIGEVPEAADTFSVEERRLLLEVDDSDELSKLELLRQFDAMRKER